MSNYRLVRLTHIDGPGEWPLHAERPTVIGRHDARLVAPDINLAPDRSVSRRHAELWRDHDSWFVKDLRSTHGTLVGGRRIAPEVPARCEPGVEIQMGATAFTLFSPSWQRLRAGALVMDLELAGRFNHALAASGVRPVLRLFVRNWGTTGLEPQRVELSWPGLGHATIMLPPLAAGESRQHAVPAFELDDRALQATADQVWRPLSVCVDAQRLGTKELGCLVLAYNEWSYLPEHRVALAAFVQPQHSAVIQLTRTATAGVPLNAGGAGLLRQVYEYLAAEWRIDYRKDRPPTRDLSQKLRLAHDVLWDPVARTGEGTCIDLAVLIASCLEGLRAQPLIALVDRGRSWHALVGCWQSARKRVDIMPADVPTVLENAVWVDPNGCTRDPEQRADCAAASDRARRDLTERPLVCVLDISAARAAKIDPLPVPLSMAARTRWQRRRGGG